MVWFHRTLCRKANFCLYMKAATHSAGKMLQCVTVKTTDKLKLNIFLYLANVCLFRFNSVFTALYALVRKIARVVATKNILSALFATS